MSIIGKTIIGIDPGSRVTGIGVIKIERTGLSVLYHDALTLPKGELGERLAVIHHTLREVIEKTQPDIMALEKVFIARNPQSALVLGHARGAAMLTGVSCGLPIVEYSATEIKKSVVGRGRADKQQVQHMMRVLLGLASAPAEDAADALAVAVCHAHHQQTNEKLARVKDRLPRGLVR